MSKQNLDNLKTMFLHFAIKFNLSLVKTSFSSLCRIGRASFMLNAKPAKFTSTRLSKFAISILFFISSVASAQTAVFTVTFDEPHIPLASATGTTILDSEYQTGGADNVDPSNPALPGSSLPAGGGFSISTSAPSNSTGESTVYNSTPGTGGQDGDLEFSNSGNVLISQEALSNTNTIGAVGNPPVAGLGDVTTFFGNGEFITPDDVPGAVEVLTFETPLESISFTLVDTEEGTVYTFTDSDGDSVHIAASNFEPGGGLPTSGQCDGSGPGEELGDSNFCVLDPDLLTVALLQSLNNVVDIDPTPLGVNNVTNNGAAFDDIAVFQVAYQNSGAIDTFSLGYETGDWTGNVSEDTDNNGTGDEPIENVTITLFQDLDGDGILTTDEINNQPNPPLVDVTDADGNYSFTGLFGNYIAVQTQPDGFNDVSENEGGFDDDVLTNPADNNQIAGFVGPGETDVNNDFVEESISGAITGNVSVDTGVNLSGVTLTLYEDTDGDGVLSAAEIDAQTSPTTTTTDGSGNYSFEDVAPGDYIVVETQPSTFSSLSEVEGGDDGDRPDDGLLNSIAVIVEPGETDSGNDFVETETLGICYGVAEGSQQFMSISHLTGEAELIGITGVPNIEAIAFGPNPVTGDRVLYAADADDFGTIDLATGVYTSIGAFGSGLLDVDSLHYDATTGMLWGVNRIGTNGVPDQLFEIDLNTGQAIPSTIVDVANITVGGALLDLSLIHI